MKSSPAFSQVLLSITHRFQRNDICLPTSNSLNENLPLARWDLILLYYRLLFLRGRDFQFPRAGLEYTLPSDCDDGVDALKMNMVLIKVLQKPFLSQFGYVYNCIHLI